MGGTAVAALLAFELNTGLIAQSLQHGWIHPRDELIIQGGCECVDGGDSGGMELAALALAHAGHQDQVALSFQSLLDERLPQAMITGGILRSLVGIEGCPEVAVALT